MDFDEEFDELMRVAAPTSQARAAAPASQQSAPMPSADDDFEMLMGGGKNASAHPPPRSSAWGDAPSTSPPPKVRRAPALPCAWRFEFGAWRQAPTVSAPVPSGEDDFDSLLEASANQRLGIA